MGAFSDASASGGCAPALNAFALADGTGARKSFFLQGTSLIYVDRCTAQQAMMKPPSGLKKLQLGLELTQELD